MSTIKNPADLPARLTAMVNSSFVKKLYGGNVVLINSYHFQQLVLTAAKTSLPYAKRILSQVL